MKTVVVTGASGFVGRWCVEALAAAGVAVVGVGRGPRPASMPALADWVQADVLDQQGIARIAAVGGDTLVHFAWTTEHGVYWSSGDNLDWAGATLRLVRAFHAGGGRRFVGVGTCAEYDADALSRPLDEAAPCLHPSTLYGAAKAATARLLAAHASQTGASFAWPRLFHLHGPGEDRRRLVPSVALKVLSGDVAACSSGLQRRDFMHVGDAGAAIAAVALSGLQGPVNIGSGRATSVGEVARITAAAAGRADLVRLGALPDRPNDPPMLLPDVSRLTEIGYKPKRDLETGLAETVAWWRQEMTDQ